MDDLKVLTSSEHSTKVLEVLAAGTVTFRTDYGQWRARLTLPEGAYKWTWIDGAHALTPTSALILLLDQVAVMVYVDV
jgi:hypothetical protein